jgi:hypothetical protein
MLGGSSDTKIGRAQATKYIGENGNVILAALDSITEKCESASCALVTCWPRIPSIPALLG